MENLKRTLNKLKKKKKELVIKIFQKSSKTWLHWLKHYQMLKQELIWNLSPQKNEEEGKLSNSFYEARITLMPRSDKGITKKENHNQYSL